MGIIIFFSLSCTKELPEPSFKSPKELVKDENLFQRGTDKDLTIEFLNQKKLTMSDTAQTVDYMLAHGDYNNLRTYSYTNDEQIIIVDIGSSTQLSRYDQSLNKSSSITKLIFVKTDSTSKIRRGDVLSFYPADASITNVSDSTYLNYFQTQFFSYKGDLQLVTSWDYAISDTLHRFFPGNPG